VEIYMVVDDAWKGSATFKYFGHEVNDVPVKTSK